jgi:hypothetical protein
MMVLLYLIAQSAVAAEGWLLESAASADRGVAVSVEAAALGDGFRARVVRRFRLGEGWMHIALVEGFPDEGAAMAAAARLREETGVGFSLVDTTGGGRTVKAPGPNVPSEKSSSPSAAEMASRCLSAHGGQNGGVAALARAPSVHFRFTRTFLADGKSVTIQHDYWRDATSRRVAVATGRFGTDSLVVVTGGGGWIKAAGRVEARDIGVLVSQADAFSPEAILGPALDVRSLFGGMEPGTLLLLEGAESGVRVGRGEDPTGSGLAFADVDPASGLLQRVRYISDAGPVGYAFSGWRERTDGLVAPAQVEIERADGSREAITVQTLEMVERPPAGTFGTPEIDAAAP